jgi:hypothetical protein
VVASQWKLVADTTAADRKRSDWSASDCYPVFSTSHVTSCDQPGERPSFR